MCGSSRVTIRGREYYYIGLGYFGGTMYTNLGINVDFCRENKADWPAEEAECRRALEPLSHDELVMFIVEMLKAAQES